MDRFVSERQVVAVVDDGKVIGIAGGIAGSCLHSGRTGRGCVLVGRSRILIICSAACIAVLGACKVDVVGHDLKSRAVVAVLVLILAGLDAAVNGDQTALLEILAHKLGLRTPSDDINEIGLTLLALTCKIAVAGDAETAHIDALGRGA